jgi:structural maintenance of chromosome 2
MKSHEILSMVEEAAGTRMYETKRVAALKTIEKKQAKLDEINSILEEEITPTLERLRGEKQNYLKWSKNSADVERIERFCIAHQFKTAQSALEENSEGVSSMEDRITELDLEAEHLREKIAEKELEIATTSSKLKGALGDQLVEKKKMEQQQSNDLVRLTSIWKNRQENVVQAEADVESAKRLVEESQAAVALKEQEIVADALTSKTILDDAKNAEIRLGQLTLEYQRMSAGMSSSVEDRTLPEQISQAHSDSKIAESKVTQAKMKLLHLSKELKVHQTHWYIHVTLISF